MTNLEVEPDGSVWATMPAADGPGWTILGLDEHLRQQFMSDGFTARPDQLAPSVDHVLVRSQSVVRVFDRERGVLQHQYLVRPAYDDEAVATGERLTEDGRMWVSCVERTLVVRDAITGAVRHRVPRACSTGSTPDLSVSVLGGPLPSADGHLVAVVCDGRHSCLIRPHDGARLVLKKGTSAARIQAMFKR